jgi:opacity protein-like surface antigen
MRKLLTLAATAVVLSSFTYASGLVSFGLQATGANINVPDPLKDSYGLGYGGGAHIDINFVPMLSLRVTGDYLSFSLDEGNFKNYVAAVAGVQASDLSVDGGRIGVLTFAANTKFTFLPLPVLSPYLTGGVGTSTISVSDLTVKYQGIATPAAGVNGQTKFSANFGPGVDLSLGGVTLYLEAKYTWIFTDNSTSTYVPVSLGITF